MEISSLLPLIHPTLPSSRRSISWLPKNQASSITLVSGLTWTVMVFWTLSLPDQTLKLTKVSSSGLNTPFKASKRPLGLNTWSPQAQMSNSRSLSSLNTLNLTSSSQLSSSPKSSKSTKSQRMEVRLSTRNLLMVLLIKHIQSNTWMLTEMESKSYLSTITNLTTPRLASSSTQSLKIFSRATMWRPLSLQALRMSSHLLFLRCALASPMPSTPKSQILKAQLTSWSLAMETSQLISWDLTPQVALTDN